ncbi:MAG: methyltransferase domain-containing protein [Actinomycetota bacterium]|nr:methyltransferase domain-containing protein [Actinomycetota bacterium]
MAARWDPATYLRFADERTRPFADLLARVDSDPTTIVDLGCGPGHLTAILRARWPRAAVVGVDSSPDMITRARAEATDPSVSYVEADLRDWRPRRAPDLLVSAATLQWVPGHLELVSTLADSVADPGVFAFTVPANFDAPSHVLLRELAGAEPYAPHTAGVEQPAAHDAHKYLTALSRPGWSVDAWETTYPHVLHGPDPVLSWISGTGARPVLQALPDELRARFEAEYAAGLRAAYPAEPHGTVHPFRRVFVVARRDSVHQ